MIQSSLKGTESQQARTPPTPSDAHDAGTPEHFLWDEPLKDHTVLLHVVSFKTYKLTQCIIRHVVYKTNVRTIYEKMKEVRVKHWTHSSKTGVTFKK